VGPLFPYPALREPESRSWRSAGLAAKWPTANVVAACSVRRQVSRDRCRLLERCGARTRSLELELVRLRLLMWVRPGPFDPADVAGVVAALKLGKKEADARVERSLYQKAVGYSYDAVKLFMPAGAKKPVTVPYVEHVPPDTTAGIFWLKNRDPQHWRDAWQIEHVTGKYVISDKPLTEDQWIKERGATVIDGDDAVDVTPKAIGSEKGRRR
jgi:hypothetical protein